MWLGWRHSLVRALAISGCEPQPNPVADAEWLQLQARRDQHNGCGDADCHNDGHAAERHGLSSHISHIHIGSCTQRGNIAIALKQVIADAQGNADVTTPIPGAVYPPANGTWYVVVHAGPDLGGTNATYLLCGNLFA